MAVQNFYGLTIQTVVRGENELRQSLANIQPDLVAPILGALFSVPHYQQMPKEVLARYLLDLLPTLRTVVLIETAFVMPWDWDQMYSIHRLHFE